jgi:hypothetical protein
MTDCPAEKLTDGDWRSRPRQQPPDGFPKALCQPLSLANTTGTIGLAGSHFSMAGSQYFLNLHHSRPSRSKRDDPSTELPALQLL